MYKDALFKIQILRPEKRLYKREKQNQERHHNAVPRINLEQLLVKMVILETKLQQLKELRKEITIQEREVSKMNVENEKALQ